MSETWLNEKCIINIPDFNCYRYDRISDSRYPHGGVAILIHSSINHKIVNVKHLDFFEEIFLSGTEFTIGSIYAPPSISVKQFKLEFSKLLSISGKIIVAGDFNAKHRAWSNQNNCRKGIELEKLCSHNLFVVNSPNDPTLYPARGLPSIVDLALSKGIYRISNPISLNELSSDHLPISFEIPSNFTTSAPL